MYLTHYCEDCNLNLCIFCLKNDEKDNKHQYHNIENILEYMPSLTKINDLIIKIKQKEEYYNNLINKINNWKRRIIFKAEELKQNLKDEIDFLKKFVTNFNQYFVNYSYFSNFYYLEEYINDINNEYLEKFNNSYNLKAETNSLIDLFCSNEKDNIEIIEKKKLNSIDILINDEMIIKKFNNRNIFINYNDIIALSYYNNEKKKLFVNISLNEKIIDKIYSVSFSINKDQIYACLLNKKIVLIFNIYEGTIVKSNQKIVDQPKKSNTHFNKCIQINDTYIATADNSFIKIWEPKIFGKNTKNYSNVKVFEIYESTSDLLLIENDFFISYQPVNQTITFINNHTFFSYNEDKIIPNIDCSNTENCLFLQKEYIIINCSQTIGIISKKTNEIIQYIEDSYQNKQNICIDDGNINVLYISTEKIFIEILKEIDGIFEKIKKYEVAAKIPFVLKIFYINNDDIIIFADKLYCLEEDNRVYEY